MPKKWLMCENFEHYEVVLGEVTEWVFSHQILISNFVYWRFSLCLVWCYLHTDGYKGRMKEKYKTLLNIVQIIFNLRNIIYFVEDWALNIIEV